MGLLKAAKQAAPKADSKAKKTKVIVPVHLGDALRELQANRDKIESLKTRNETLELDIKPVASEEFLRLVKIQGRKPDSFILQSAGHNMLVIVQDKYLKMTETKEATLIDHGFGDMIQETTIYKFDPVLAKKYEEQIDAALEAMDIPAEDKALLVKADVEKVVRKGTIDRISTPGFKNADLAMHLIEPIIQLKNQPNATSNDEAIAEQTKSVSFT